MKLNDPKLNVKVSGDFETKEFGFQFNAKMADMLSSTLYVNKIRAVLREISTNALDAHIESKNCNPINVHLPTLENPNFIVQDFGTGMSPEKVNDVYTIYGASDKTHTNTQTGALGLGSKSFLCYNTKSATIENVYRGIKYIYFSYINTHGIPVLSKISESPTDDSNGLKVIIPVKTADISTFKKEAEEVYRYFEIRPNFTGNIPNIEEDEIEIQGPDFYIHKVKKINYYSTRKECIVVMASVAYSMKLKTEDKALQALQNQNIVIHVPNGSCSFNLGRESLAYDDRTTKYLTKRLNEIIKYLSKDVQQKVNKASCKYDAICEYWESPLKEIMKIDYQGQRLPQSSYGVRSYGSVSPEKIMVYEKNSNKAFSTRDLPYRRNILILERDKRDIRPRINHLLSSYDSIYCIEFKDDKNKKDWLDDVGLLSIKPLSDYKPQKLLKVAGITSGGRTKYVAKELKVDRWSWNVRRSWNGISELPKDCVMVELDGKYNSDIDFSTLRVINDRLIKIGIKNIPTIVGVKEVEKGKHLKDWIKSQLETKIGKVINILPPNVDEKCTINVLKKKLKIKFIESEEESLCKLVGIPTKEVDLSKYPLLEHISYMTPETIIEDYIDTIDKCVPHTESKE